MNTPTLRWRVMEMFPVLLNIVAVAREVWNSCRSSHDEGSLEWGRAGWGGRGHRETDRGWPSGQIMTKLRTESARFLLPLGFVGVI